MPNVRKTTCPKGHAYDEKNTRWTSQNGHNKPYQQCKACIAAKHKTRYHCDPVYRARQKTNSQAYKARQNGSSIRDLIVGIHNDSFGSDT